MFHNLKFHTINNFGGFYNMHMDTGTHETVHFDGHFTDDAHYVS